MINHLLNEIRRRRVIQILAPYAIASWLLMQIVTLVVPALTLPQWINSLVVVLLLAGFPVALYVAWFFDFTEDGLTRTPGPDDEDIAAPLTTVHWFGLGAITLAAFGFGFLSFGNVRENLANPDRVVLATAVERSVAILPFRDLSPEQDQRYLVDGLAEELTVALGKLPGLRVTALGSAISIRDRSLAPQERAALLGVSTLLQGSVRLTGDRLNVTATLINGLNGQTLWTEKFTRSFDDVFVIEEEIARAIMGVLLDRYIDKDGDPVIGRATAADAYVMYLKGRHEFRARTTESLKLARKFFEQAISSDPEYAPAYVGLADSVRLLSKGQDNFGDLDPEIAVALASQNLEKAFVRDDALADGYASLGLIETARGNMDAALAAYDKALDINRNLAKAHLWRYRSLVRMSRLDEALASLETAFDLDPLSPTVLHNYGIELLSRGRFEEAGEMFDTIIELDPSAPLGYRGKAGAAFRAGDLSGSAQAWMKVSQLSEESTQYKDEIIQILLNLELADPVRSIVSDDLKVNVLIADGEYDKVLKHMKFEVGANPDDPWVLFEAGLYHLLYGDPIDAAPLFGAMAPDLPAADIYFMPYCSPAIEMAFVLQISGQEDAANGYLEECAGLLAAELKQDYVSAEHDYLGARLAALSGNEDEAVRLLGQAIEHGWREYWTVNDPLLHGLKDDLDYQAAVGFITEDLARQREELAAVSKDWFTQ